MKLSKWLRAALLPLTNLSVFFSLLAFWLLIALAAAARMFGVWLAILILPALFRYLTNLVETTGRGLQPEPPGTEFFRWIGDSWSLFPAVIVVALAWASYGLYGAAGAGPMIVLLVAAGLLYPAVLGVLSITHSPLQSVNPVALRNFIARIGLPYWVAPAYLALIVYLSTVVQIFPYLIDVFLEMLMIFSLHSVVGCIMSAHDIFEDVSIPDDVEPGDEELAQHLEKKRAAILSHAYGFISRGNREGGFKHIVDEIAGEPDVAAAWAWYFDRMLRWEQKQHALFFAQRYVHDLLLHGEKIPAIKVIMRCRLIDEKFRPLGEDTRAAILAAESTGNNEVAAVLRGR
jgi:hypothetical protein